MMLSHDAEAATQRHCRVFCAPILSSHLQPPFLRPREPWSRPTALIQTQVLGKPAHTDFQGVYLYADTVKARQVSLIYQVHPKSN